MMKYRIAIRESEEGFSVSCPGLPGCHSQGANRQEALDNIADAIREYRTVAAQLHKDEEICEIEVAA
ncbi:MAG: type II toxin-antitoxin system HicB family antitoxin [Gammaproteobacteria bacterium]